MRMTILAAFTVLIAAPCQADQQPPPRHPRAIEIEKRLGARLEEPAEQVFGNIQTFKGMSALRVLRIMEMAFAPNLGVDCDYCHVVGEWARDDKPTKQIARGMWRLRSSAQEQARQILGRQDVPLTCYTCHKGQPKPAFAPE
jgi:hypothetical protein